MDKEKKIEKEINKLFSTSKIKEGENALQNGLIKYPDNLVLLKRALDINILKGKNEVSLKIVNKLIKLEPYKGILLKQKIGLLKKLKLHSVKRKKDLFETYEQLIKVEKFNVLCKNYVSFATELSRLGEFENSIIYYDKAIQLFEKDNLVKHYNHSKGQYLMLNAVNLRDISRYKDALNYIDLAEQAGHWEESILRNRCLTYQLMKANKELKKELKKHKEYTVSKYHSKKEVNIIIRRIKLLLQLNKKEQAKKELIVQLDLFKDKNSSDVSKLKNLKETIDAAINEN